MTPNTPSNLLPWSSAVDDVLQYHETSQYGLSKSVAADRLAVYGTNELPVDTRFKILKMIVRQFTSPLIIILILGGIVTTALREWIDSIAIFAAVLINAALGFYQEGKADRALSALAVYAKDFALVLREGRHFKIESRLLVPGDIVRIQHGDRVPADGRIITSTDCEIDESLLTGESLPVAKVATAVPASVRLSDRVNMAYMGTTVVEGYADMVVVATGNSTELGAIAKAVQSVGETTTPLQKKLIRFTYYIAVLVLALAAGLFFFGISQGMTTYTMFMISVAVAVSAVPEGLPIALTVILAIGVERVAKNKGIIRNLLAAETLGSTTIVLTDKTGTLTEARMRLDRVVPYGALDERELITALVLHSDCSIENPHDNYRDWKIIARPIETGVVLSAAEQGILQPDVRADAVLIERMPFTSSRKYSASLFMVHGKRTAIYFGAPEVIVALSQGTVAVGPVLADVDAAALAGDRVLAVAYVDDVPEGWSLDDVVRNNAVSFAGIALFRDPLRTSVHSAIERITRAGVRMMIVTGDHPGTAQTVARQLGWEIQPHQVLTGADIEVMDDTVLLDRLQTARIIARVIPEQKLRIARLLRSRGEIVAMTGDGVNDAPALREADIGIALGAGSDVAKASADMILLDNNFEVIVLAIEEGRKVLQNIRKVIAYLMSSVFDELVLIAGALVLGLALPLSALQILWVNLMIGALPAVALAFESHASDIGQRPMGIRRRLLDGQLRFLIFGVGTLTSILLMGMYYGLMMYGFDPATVRTFIFAAFSAYALFLVFSVRSLQSHIFSYPIFGNKYLLGAVVIGFGATAAAVYVPIIQTVLGTVALSLPWVIGVLVFGGVSIALVEGAKYLYRNK